MLALSVLTTRIAAQMPQLKRVAGFADLVAARGKVTVFPAAYVIPERESAEENSLIGIHDQRISESFTVLLLAKNVTDARGLAAQEEVKALSDALRAALLGWQPSTAHTPLDLVSAGPLELADQILFWPETYKTRYYVRN